MVTPLWTNNVTPFLRWSSGDLVTLREAEAGEGPFSVFPLVKHAHRTTGFFKVRGINLNHAELEDFMFRNVGVADFKAELVSARDLDVLRLSIEVRRDSRAVAGLGRPADIGARYLRADARSGRARRRHAREGIRGECQNAALCRPAAVEVSECAECAAVRRSDG